MTANDLNQFFTNAPWAIAVLAAAALWSITWQLVGMWVAARNGHKAWFVVFVFVHTLGILEILYLSSQRRASKRS